MQGTQHFTKWQYWFTLIAMLLTMACSISDMKKNISNVMMSTLSGSQNQGTGDTEFSGMLVSIVGIIES